MGQAGPSWLNGTKRGLMGQSRGYVGPSRAKRGQAGLSIAYSRLTRPGEARRCLKGVQGVWRALAGISEDWRGLADLGDA